MIRADDLQAKRPGVANSREMVAGVDPIAPLPIVREIARSDARVDRVSRAEEEAAAFLRGSFARVRLEVDDHVGRNRHHLATSITIAMPMPPPMHNAATPLPPPRFFNA